MGKTSIRPACVQNQAIAGALRPPVRLEKIQDRDNAMITERALVVRPEGKVEEWTMRMAVKEDNSFTLSDDAKTVDGTGKLFGPAWKWTYFKGTFKTKNGIVIEDENF